MDIASEGNRTKEVICEMSESEASAESTMERMNKTFLCMASSTVAESVMNLAYAAAVPIGSSIDAVSDRFLVKEVI